ncbi:YdhK family protein [Paenibacillus glycanilyticus]|uniref:YdhK family protein n=1 Tax=Paenibacillus glycanilyticus TaxID=126569 RepID=UPI0019101FE6|nr:YdhK family protein [Paenibacillus glycanilyticus]
MKKSWILIIAIVMIAGLSACGNNAGNSNMEHSAMSHSGSGEIPAGLKEEPNPTYKPGSQAVIQEGHMPGMKGAVATIVGAYKTTAYVVDYTPTNGGEKVSGHKWVIQQEMKDAGEKELQPGAQVVLNADHMPGMMGATAEIVSAEQTTVYMVDYTPTNGGAPVKNHMWVTESELSPAKSKSTSGNSENSTDGMQGMNH